MNAQQQQYNDSLSPHTKLRNSGSDMIRQYAIHPSNKVSIRRVITPLKTPPSKTPQIFPCFVKSCTSLIPMTQKPLETHRQPFPLLRAGRTTNQGACLPTTRHTNHARCRTQCARSLVKIEAAGRHAARQARQACRRAKGTWGINGTCRVGAVDVHRHRHISTNTFTVTTLPF
jgi:hypothetical protein